MACEERALTELSEAGAGLGVWSTSSEVEFADRMVGRTGVVLGHVPHGVSNDQAVALGGSVYGYAHLESIWKRDETKINVELGFISVFFVQSDYFEGAWISRHL